MPTLPRRPLHNKEINTIFAHSDVSVYKALTMGKDKLGILTQKTRNDTKTQITNIYQQKPFPKLPVNSAHKVFLQSRRLEGNSTFKK